MIHLLPIKVVDPISSALNIINKQIPLPRLIFMNNRNDGVEMEWLEADLFKFDAFGGLACNRLSLNGSGASGIATVVLRHATIITVTTLINVGNVPSALTYTVWHRLWHDIVYCIHITFWFWHASSVRQPSRVSSPTRRINSPRRVSREGQVFLTKTVKEICFSDWVKLIVPSALCYSYVFILWCLSRRRRRGRRRSKWFWW